MGRRTKQDRPVLTYEASQALEEAKEPFFKIEHAIDRLDEEDLTSGLCCCGGVQRDADRS